MNNHLIDDQAKVQLKKLRKLSTAGLNKKQNKIMGIFQKEPYVWIAFDNRKGSLWVGTWLHKGHCIDWLYKNPEK